MGLFGKARQKAQWPSAIATVDEIYVDPENTKAIGSGAFTVNGEYYSVLIDRAFRRLRDAEAWVTRVEASPNVTVRYNPEDPSDNVVDDQAF